MKNKFILLIIFTPYLIFSQNLLIGRVVDVEGNPIPYANILIEGTTIGTSSDLNGQFQVNYRIEKKDKMVVSCIGYDTKIVSLENYDGYMVIKLDKKTYSTDEIVVTGTKTFKRLKDTPVLTEIITKSDIKYCGYKTLKDVLMEQTGLVVIDNHGSGIQVQGLDPDYTLIMIDGDPVIGRTAGTVDLLRFDVDNLKQIEIVKGPASSLYGSEALAGVINLITHLPEEPYKFQLNSQIGTYKSYFINGNFSISYKNLKSSLFISRRGSDGYDLNEESVSKTAPHYSTTTINPQIEYKLNNNQFIKLNLRWYNEKLDNDAEIFESNKKVLLKDKDKIRDINLSFSYNFNLSNTLQNHIKFYLSNYLTENLLSYAENSNVYETSKFNQYYYKGEYYALFPLGKQNLISYGTGYVLESVNADRIEGDDEKINSHFFYMQHEWILSKFIDIVWGGRYDYHKNYSSRFSPKISIVLKPFEAGKINLSIGSGFKAPTLQQLYLNFTNPTVGYSVFGSTNFTYNFEKLKSEGQINKILINPNEIKKLKAENSWSFNLTFELEIIKENSLSLNLFRNNVNELIDALPVAIKKNGQSIYTYFNLNKIFTQGIESDLIIKPFENLKIKIGYQYLEAFDVDVLNRIKNGEIFKISKNGRLVKVNEKDYGGLFNRSTHNANISLIYENSFLGLNASLRGALRSKYGFYDTNGNGILDDNQEYAPGYSIWNFTFNKFLHKHFQLQLRIENIFDKKLTGTAINLPGRIIYGGISINY